MAPVTLEELLARLREGAWKAGRDESPLAFYKRGCRDALKMIEDLEELRAKLDEILVATRGEVTRLKAREVVVREELRHWRAQLVADEPLLPRQVDAVLEQVAP